MRIPVYPAEIEEQMRNFYNSLSEKQRRCYAAVEATKLGYGGITYLGSVLPYDAGTVALGREEIKKPLPEQEQNIRKPGGGRKSRLAVTVGLDAAFLLEKHDFRPRQAFKTEAGKLNIPYRDAQFKNIERLKEEYHSQGNPVMSMDVKKKS